MALQRGESPRSISLWTRREESVTVISEVLPGCRISCDLRTAVAEAEIVVLCTSPLAIENSGTALASVLPASSVVTDAASVKVRIVGTLERALGGRFVGAHPMAGSEQSGISSARSDLFDNAVCILTPTARTDSAALEKVRKFWREAGSRVHEMSPAAHDSAMARISHLPHAVAAALVHAALRADPGIARLAGSGYRDTTRVAAGPEGLWREIFLKNREELLAAISDLQVSLGALKNALSQEDGDTVESFLHAARVLRSQENEPA